MPSLVKSQGQFSYDISWQCCAKVWVYKSCLDPGIGGNEYSTGKFGSAFLLIWYHKKKQIFHLLIFQCFATCFFKVR